MTRFTLLFCLSIFTLISCKQKDQKITESFLPDDFEVFYAKFHSDSLYQIQHIQFPLEGATKAKGGKIDLMIPVKWEQEDWIMHKPFNDHNQTFERKFYYIGHAIIEKINDRNQFFSMERRFAKFNDEWQLIYYGVSN